MSDLELTTLVMLSEQISRHLDEKPLAASEYRRLVEKAFAASDSRRVDQLARAVPCGLAQSGVVLESETDQLVRTVEDDAAEYVETRFRGEEQFPRSLAREIAAVEAAGEVSFDLDEDDLWFGSVISQVERKLRGLDEAAVPEVVAAVLHGLAPTGLVVLDQHLRPWPDHDGALDRILDDWQRSGEEPGFEGPWLGRLPSYTEGAERL